MTNDDICNFISHRMKVHDNLETICNEVIDTCLYKVRNIIIRIYQRILTCINKPSIEQKVHDQPEDFPVKLVLLTPSQP